MQELAWNGVSARELQFSWYEAGTSVIPAGCHGLATAADNREPAPTPLLRTMDEMVTDGRLDETSWLSAIPRTRFYEIYPANAGQPPVATTVSFLYDDRNLYVAVRALDPEPDAICFLIVRRDQVLSDQDYVEVFLDPLNTRRSALFFRVNARGIVTDGQYDDKNRLRDESTGLQLRRRGFNR